MIFLKLIRAITLAGSFLAVGSAWAGIPDSACGTTVYDLLQTKSKEKLGTVTVANDAANLYVKFALTVAGSKFDYLNVWAGTDPLNKPQNPYLFPNPRANVNATEYTYVLPLSKIGIIDITNSCPTIVFAAFARISDGEYIDEALAQGRYLLCCEEPPVVGACETAFAKGGFVFTTDAKSNPEGLPSLNLNKNRWGWAINVTTPGETTYQIWKGAGLNDTSKGELVGTLTVIVNGSSVTVTYNLTDDLMSELHIYVGDLVPKTIAPGQYGYTQNFDPPVSTHTATFSVTDTNYDGIWLIAHAVSCAVLD